MDKAIKAAEEIAVDLGITVILGARHNQPSTKGDADIS